MQTLTKLTLNNKIVEFRKPVRQSRVRCIHKLSREIKRLKEKKGTDEQKAKNLKKAERFVEEILIMKKVKDDEISKFALLNEKTLTSITNDIHESPKNKALARLAHHKTIAEKVQNFRETFPEWRECIHLFLETLGEKYKHKKKPTKTSKKELKINKSRMKKESKTMNESETKNESIITNKSGIWTVESIPAENPIEKQFVQKYSILKKSVDEDAVEEKLDKEYVTEGDNVKHVNNSGVTELPVRDERLTEEKSLVEGAVDPFFLTKDNDKYVSVSAKENTSNNEQETELNKRWKREFNSVVAKGNTRNKQREYEQNKPRQREFNRDRDFGKRRDRGFDHYRKEITAEPQPVLHPSWEAKKKLTQPVRFEGKKIKFDDS